MDRHQKFGIILIPNLVLHKKPYVRKIRQPLVSSFRRTMINRPTVGAAAAAFAGLAAAASITNSLPLAQAFVAPSPAQQPVSAHVPRRQSPVTTAISTSTCTSRSMSYGSGEECPEIPTAPLLSKSFDVAVIALG